MQIVYEKEVYNRGLIFSLTVNVKDKHAELFKDIVAEVTKTVARECASEFPDGMKIELYVKLGVFDVLVAKLLPRDLVISTLVNMTVKQDLADYANR